VPSAGTGGQHRWIHVVATIDPTAALIANLIGVWCKTWPDDTSASAENALTGTTLFWLDNVKLIANSNTAPRHPGAQANGAAVAIVRRCLGRAVPAPGHLHGQQHRLFPGQRRLVGDPFPDDSDQQNMIRKPRKRFFVRDSGRKTGGAAGPNPMLTINADFPGKGTRRPKLPLDTRGFF